MRWALSSELKHVPKTTKNISIIPLSWYEYLKDTEILTSLLKINEPKRTLIISSVNPNTVKKIEEIAINCGITKAEIVRKILLDYLKNETPNDQIEEQKQ